MKVLCKHRVDCQLLLNDDQRCVVCTLENCREIYRKYLVFEQPNRPLRLFPTTFEVQFYKRYLTKQLFLFNLFNRERIFSVIRCPYS